MNNKGVDSNLDVSNCVLLVALQVQVILFYVKTIDTNFNI